MNFLGRDSPKNFLRQAYPRHSVLKWAYQRPVLRRDYPRPSVLDGPIPKEYPEAGLSEAYPEAGLFPRDVPRRAWQLEEIGGDVVVVRCHNIAPRSTDHP
eukprot:CAMPEP_0180279360 /NCGR_PEP_ID=MMETSP0988-20121125/8021_1 /TAXON_ID=697907 /ORGANISM="non described non described, Strain CCMP2293" /LENGTH=99 /DNA_ID=CAMNT_0022251061 /DNA_START=364 /DNA_END=660 /DNA_ORIENTATION=-